MYNQLKSTHITERIQGNLAKHLYVALANINTLRAGVRYIRALISA